MPSDAWKENAGKKREKNERLTRVAQTRALRVAGW
jgi:hypothetical protein